MLMVNQQHPPHRSPGAVGLIKGDYMCRVSWHYCPVTRLSIALEPCVALSWATLAVEKTLCWGFKF